MKVRNLIAVSAIAPLALAGCASTHTDDPDPTNHDPAIVRPGPDSPDSVSLASDLNDVGYDLFHVLAARDDQDVVLSPLSIGLAFGMLDLGATDGVAAALDDLFAYPVEGDARWSAFNTLEQALVSESGDEVVTTSADEWAPPPAPILRIANREFYDVDFSTASGYDDALQRWFGAGIESLPLRTDSEGSRIHINGWVSDKTQGLIPDLLPQGSISPETVMVLVNALYLKAQWGDPFTADFTTDGPFTLVDGTTATVPFMHNGALETTASLGDGYAAIDLPYASSNLSMLVVMPDVGRYDEIEGQLDGSFVAGVDASLKSASVNLSFPRFESETAFDLGDAIENGLDVHGIFGVPELGGIGDGVVVSKAIHAAKITVDEDGTEAAAATAIILDRAIMETQVIELTVDRPFLYVIRDNATGAVLFVGRVLDPRA